MHTDDAILDRITPAEAHLPPSARTWARLIRLPGGWPCLELRDPNDGLGGDPATKTRHQYLVRRDRLWHRALPPAPLDQADDESPWRDEDPDRRTMSAWTLVAPGAGLPWQWGQLPPYVTTPQRVGGAWDIHGSGDPETVGYVMPPRNPWDAWADVTDTPCPHPGCGQLWTRGVLVADTRADANEG